MNVLIALDGSALDARIIDLAGLVLAGKELEITMLHVVPIPLGGADGWGATAVLEGFLTVEACGAEMAPLVEQLHARLDQTDQECCRREPRLAPRHLIHRDEHAPDLDRCAIARQRRDSIDLLAAYAQSLRRHGIDPATVTKDSAIGNPVEVIRETARHFGADLVLVGGGDSRQTRQVVEDAGQAASAPYSVLVVPPVNQAVARVKSATVGCVPATPE